MQLVVTPGADGARLEAHLSDGAGRIWFEWQGPPGWSLQPPANANFALAAALVHAMKSGSMLHVAGAVDAKLLRGAERYTQAWSSFRSDLYRPVAISADEELEASAERPDRGFAYALSGGVDSTFSLLRNVRNEGGRENRKPACAFLIREFDHEKADEQWRAELKSRTAGIAEALGVPFLYCSTNWRDFCGNYLMDHGLGIAAAAHALAASASGCVIAADHTYRQELEVMPWGNNQLTNPLLSAESFEIADYGSFFSRMEKLAYLAATPDMVGRLAVCGKRYKAEINCGKCEKCLRTACALLILTGRVEPLFREWPSAARIACLKQLSATGVTYWRDILRALPRRFGTLRLACRILLWRSRLPKFPRLASLRAIEIKYLRPLRERIERRRASRRATAMAMGDTSKK